MYKIEKGVKMPSGRKKTALLYPFDTMEVGESFFVSVSSYAERQNAWNNQIKRKRSVRSAMMTSMRGALFNRKIKDKSFTLRAVDEPEPGVRCWRFK